MTTMAAVGRSGFASVRTRSRTGVETGGQLVVLAIESVASAVGDIIHGRFSWTEFKLIEVEQNASTYLFVIRELQ